MPCRSRSKKKDAFVSSLVGDLVSEKNDKCQVVRKFEDHVLNVKGKVKGFIHEERKVLAEKQSKEKKNRRGKRRNIKRNCVNFAVKVNVIYFIFIHLSTAHLTLTYPLNKLNRRGKRRNIKRNCVNFAVKVNFVYFIFIHLSTAHLTLTYPLNKLNEMKNSLKSLNISVSEAKRENDAALAAKWHAQESTRLMAQERDEAFKLLSQYTWDFALQAEELNLALEHLSHTSFSFRKNNMADLNDGPCISSAL